MVGFDQSTELLPAMDFTMRLRSEVRIKNSIPDVSAAMRALREIMMYPASHDVVHLPEREQHKVIQGLGLEPTDEGFAERVAVGRSDGQTRGFNAGFLPEFQELFGELRIAVHQQPADLDAFLLHPHGRIASLLHHPGFVRMERGRAAIDTPRFQVD